LNDHHIQALADAEGTAEMRQHAASCAACGARLRARIALMEDIERSLDVPIEMPAALAEAVNVGLKADATHAADANRTQAAGATRLLPNAGRGLRLEAEGSRRWIYAVSAVAATLAGVLFVAPALRTRDSTLSASAILARSASQLAAVPQSGVEILEYELVLDGVPKEMMPDDANGTYHVRQAIDHDVPGRFRFATFALDGTMLTSIAQDPKAGRRVASFTVDDQPYRFEMSLPAKDAGLSLPEIERLHMEATIAMMQSSGHQLIETVDGPNGRKLYRIEAPRLAGPGTSPVWDLTDARVVIDARDYRVTELAVSGSFMKQAYSLSYRLITHMVAGSVSPDMFTVPPRPGEIVIAGEGTAVPTHDVFMLSLRELTRLKHAR
jgi:hypothetical protein